MLENNSIVLEISRNSSSEYLVKDRNGISIGRIFLMEVDNENKYCLFKLNFYKNSNDNYKYLLNTLQLILSILFRNLGMLKVSVMINENINLDAFINLGFKLEGVIQRSTYLSGDAFSRFILGIDSEEFNDNCTYKALLLKGRDICLKILTPQHDKLLLDYYKRNKEYLKPYEPKREETFYTIEVQRKTLIESYKNYLNSNEFNFGIFKDEKLIGKIRISSIVYGVFNSGFLGYSIDEKMQNRGYMKEAVKLVMEYCFKKINLHRLEASTLVDNIKSQKVLKACGFKETGVNKKYLLINGKWRDHILFYRIKE